MIGVERVNFTNQKKQLFRMFNKTIISKTAVKQADLAVSTVNDPSVIKEGYITKLRSKKKRYFVLYTDTEKEAARLDYYETEKKYRTNPTSYRRSIMLKDCFAVIRKNDPRFKKNNICVFAIYTRNDCFSLTFDSQEDMNAWFSLINEVHLKSLAKNRADAIHDYDKIWYAVIKDKRSKIRGSFYLCLTAEEIHLYQIANETNLKDKDKRLSLSSDKSANQTENDQSLANAKVCPQITDHTMKVLRFPFSLIRSFGHQSNNLFIHLGRSSDIGSCQLWFELKDCDTSQYIHSLVASTRAAAKNEFRTRSNSENNRMLSRRNKSMSDKQSLNQSSISHSKTTTSIQPLNTSTSSKSSSSLKFNNKSITCDNKLIKNEKDNSTEYVASPVAYSSVAYTLARSRSTSESSSSQQAHFAQAKQNFQNFFKAKQQLLNQSSNQMLSNESIQTIDSNDEEKDSDYYMTAPNNIQTSTCSIKEDDYLVVDESLFDQASSLPSNRTFSNASTIQLSNKSDTLKSSDFRLVSTTGPLASKLAQQQPLIEGSRYVSVTHHSPTNHNNNFVELPDCEELNDQVDEYIQVELGANKSSKLEVIGSEPSSTSDSSKTTSNAEQPPIQPKLAEEEDYIEVDSFSSTANTTINQETENFEVNLSPISSASTSRVKTFSMSSNNTSNNELNSLGTSPSLMSNAHFNITPASQAKDEVYKLDKVKSYFNSTEDCGDYIKPVRTYSMGSRPQLPSHHKFRTTSHCSTMTKSNTLNGPTLSNNQSLMNHSTKKVQCIHLPTENSESITCHFDENLYLKDNRVRAASMGSHSINKKDAILRKLRLSQLHRQENAAQDGTIEDEESSEKCLSTPTLADQDYTRHRSATFTAPFASASSKRANEDSSEEDDMMCIDLGKTPGFENEITYNQISIKEKFKELSLDSA